MISKNYPYVTFKKTFQHICLMIFVNSLKIEFFFLQFFFSSCCLCLWYYTWNFSRYFHFFLSFVNISSVPTEIAWFVDIVGIHKKMETFDYYFKSLCVENMCFIVQFLSFKIIFWFEESTILDIVKFSFEY